MALFMICIKCQLIEQVRKVIVLWMMNILGSGQKLNLCAMWSSSTSVSQLHSTVNLDAEVQTTLMISMFLTMEDVYLTMSVIVLLSGTVLIAGLHCVPTVATSTEPAQSPEIAHVKKDIMETTALFLSANLLATKLDPMYALNRISANVMLGTTVDIAITLVLVYHMEVFATVVQMETGRVQNAILDTMGIIVTFIS